MSCIIAVQTSAGLPVSRALFIGGAKHEGGTIELSELQLCLAVSRQSLVTTKKNLLPMYFLVTKWNSFSTSSTF